MLRAQLAQLIPVIGSVIFSLDMEAHFVRGIALRAMRFILEFVLHALCPTCPELVEGCSMLIMQRTTDAGKPARYSAAG